MITVLQDSFTDGDGVQLENHVAEIGSWVRRAIGDYAQIKSNAMSNQYYLLSYYNANMSANQDMTVQFQCLQKGIEKIAFLCRMSSGEPLEAYGLLYAGTFSDDKIWKFIRYDAGVIVVLKTFSMVVIANDVVKFEVVGITLNCYLNDVIIDTIDDSAYVTGLAGFRYIAWGATVSRWDNALIEVSGVVKVDHLPLMGVH